MRNLKISNDPYCSRTAAPENLLLICCRSVGWVEERETYHCDFIK